MLKMTDDLKKDIKTIRKLLKDKGYTIRKSKHNVKISDTFRIITNEEQFIKDNKIFEIAHDLVNDNVTIHLYTFKNNKIDDVKTILIGDLLYYATCSMF